MSSNINKVFARFTSLFIIFILAISSFTAFAAESADAVYIYVSADNGNDNNVGSIEFPLKTIGAAQKMAVLNSGKEVHVVFRGGTYRFMDSVQFTAEHSGTPEAIVYYEGYEGEKIDFKASVELDISKAQPVTDEKIRARMYSHVVDNIVVLDLLEQGIRKDQLLDTSAVNSSYGLKQQPYNNENNAIYINDKEQVLAHWPNDNHYAHSPKSLNNQTMYYSEETPGRWTEAKDWWLGLWPNYDFQYTRMGVKELDTVNKTITVVDGHSYPLNSYMSRRWCAFNLMEEIDVPGEYYIDRENMKLYLYPPYSLKDATVEMSITPSPIFLISDASNMVFRGITFSQTRGNAVIMSRVDNVDFIDCIFRDIGYIGISASGGTKPKTNSKHWHNLIMRDDSSYRVDVSGCEFYNIGCSAVCLAGGNLDTLTESEGVVENNFISGVSQKSWWDAIEVRGCGWTVRNNHINNARKQAIYPAGNTILVEYNEIYDVMRETGDAGAIYWGGDVVYRDTMVQYNYIHDCAPIEKTGAGTIAIYWDDCQSGQSAQYNLIKGMHSDFNSNGAGATLHQYNTTVECTRTMTMHAHPYRATDIVTQAVYGGSPQEAIADIYDKALYFSRYPDLIEYEKGVNPKKFTKVIGNVAINTGSYGISDEDKHFGTFIDNQKYDNVSNDIFVDAANQDYRLKSDSEIAKANPNILNDANFDIESIGLKDDLVLDENTAPFRMLYPKNGQSAVSTKKSEFVWDKAYGSNKYRLIVATDRALTNRVYDEIVSYNTMPLENLEKGKTYFWTVYAINGSREMGNQWQAQTGVYSFSTALYESIDVAPITYVVNKMEDKLATLKVSTNPGDYKPESLGMFKKYLSLTKYLIEKQPTGLTEERLNQYGSYLETYFSDPSKVNRGFADLSKYFDASNWNGVEVTKDAVTLLAKSTTSNYGGSSALEAISENVIYCFDAEFNLAPDGYMTIGMSAKNNAHQYVESNPGNYIVLKHGLVEFQRAGYGILETRELNLLDGKKHSFMMGRIRLDMGNYFVLYVDGELLFSLAEVDGTEFSDLLQIVFCVYNAGDMVRLTKFSGEIPTADKYNDFITMGMYTAAKAIRDNFEINYVNPSVMNLDSNRFFTKDGTYEMSHKPVLEGGDELYVTKEVIEKILGCTVNGTNVAGLGNVSTKVVDGVTLLSIKQACNLMGKAYTYDWENCNLIVADSGALVVNNEQTRLKKLTILLKAMENYPVADFANVIK